MFKLILILILSGLVGSLILNILLKDTNTHGEYVKDYKSYLKSSHWKKTRAKKLRQVNYCEKCGRMKNLQVHHLRYKRNGKPILYAEQMSDLQVLCRHCHARHHGKAA